ncbi:hypothetical protein SERLA73DRAFT_70430 [Serpula lacrymans var. lacrymans S7.3]|uniref:DUF4238 domain-containing protein n=2 Tax=Serpula lacrymans var. lacrymans TaxID=341189 RepID=F8PMW9_SERL3|nr:uncharacterized protein SERLADRAFT_434549 [Serpula lacrymans var. lacrymans S7.9]EGO02951.1 hypothetical protein SERLA73DRAFT_70430 [Serpula lacrymans var. lacrymans S7.3]EGO28635.1 hypothetical protein SERLADRAFT_434549 [Serpula lacrymans var. lacrymans S7.9]
MSDESLLTSVPSTENQYHHFIPRFILRRYQVGPKRKKHFLHNGIDPEYIFYYDLTAETLDIRPIGNVYGIRNLYKDIHNIDNINELEHKLSFLESEAATIITGIHAPLAGGKFCLKRRALEQLRKFLFLMHYRACSSTYFQEDHPKNIGLRDWVAQTRRKNRLDSAGELFLHVLRYYLDTPHSQIMLHAEELTRTYGSQGVTEMCNGYVNPKAEHYPALAYRNQAGTYFLCIWEAADGEEFLLSSNGFGLWEGLEAGESGLHRIFVVSPRVAIVLRSWVMRPEVLPLMHGLLHSSLLDIYQPPPTPTYADGSNMIRKSVLSKQGVNQYRATKSAQEDNFTFEITKLTKLQTYAINSVILTNVPDTGAVTGLSLECMYRTTRTFCDSPMGNLNGCKFKGLMRRLSNSSSPTSSSTAQETPDLAAMKQSLKGDVSPPPPDRDHNVKTRAVKMKEADFHTENSDEEDLRTSKRHFPDLEASVAGWQSYLLQPLVTAWRILRYLLWLTLILCLCAVLLCAACVSFMKYRHSLPTSHVGLDL